MYVRARVCVMVGCVHVSVCVCVCECVYVHLCVMKHMCECVGICTYAHIYKGQSRTLAVLDHLHLIALRQASSLDQKLSLQPGWPASELLGFAFLCSPTLVSQTHKATTSFLCRCWRLGLRLAHLQSSCSFPLSRLPGHLLTS